MKTYSKIIVLAALVASAMVTCAQISDGGIKLHGSIQSDILLPEKDEAIGTGDYSEWALTNTYADLNLTSKFVDAGVRLEYLEHPLPGFEPDFKGWGIPHFYAKLKAGRAVEATIGDFYEQFGSGLILRTYEERSLGIDNAIRGARVNVNPTKGIRLKALGGVQRRYWDWSKEAWLAGVDAEVNFEQWSKTMQEKGISWMIGASYVMVRHEEDPDIVVPGTNYRLNLPSTVGAFDVRSQLQIGSYNILAEYAMKSQDPSFDNGYIYRRGNALLLSASYSKRGMSLLLQAKRSEDMAFRTQRTISGIACFVNNMPAFAYQHTYALATIYPYATQAADGEWAFQAEAAYNFKRNTPLGGKYGTKLKLNISHIRGLGQKTLSEADAANQKGFTTMGTKGYEVGFFDMGGIYYQDINVQMEKKLTKSFKLNLMYMNQRYDKTVVEGSGGVIKANIGVAEGKYQFNKKLTLRGEVQYLQTNQDEGDWAYGLLELSVLPRLMFTVSDMWNCGDTNLHYYMASVTANFKSNRLMVGYGRTRAGYNCSGGVCRYVPASRGLQVSYNYNF
ncbi:MAG: DUF6029 family protein [Prevotella sp.]